MLRKLFGKKDTLPETKDLTIEDLIALERWDEAIGMLHNRVEVNPNDLHAHLRLAETYVQAGRNVAALDEYYLVADEYTDDGFYDKAIALLSKIARLAPGDSAFEGRIRRAQQLKELEHRRTLAMEGLTAAQEEKDPLARLSLIEAQILWQGVQSSDFVTRLSGDQLRRLFENSVLVEPEQGAILAERGSKVEQLFIFAGGEAEALYDRGDGRPVHIHSFDVGDIIGDRSLFEHQPWPATYRVTDPGRLFRLDANGLEKALLGNPDPRALIDALRARRSDHDVAAAVRKLESFARLMSVRPIILYPDPVLRRSAAPVERFDAELAELVRDLAETMYAAPGVGLAAPQIGVERRVAVVDVAPGAPESKLYVLVNPAVVAAEGRESGDEGCLSIPGLTERVDRPKRVTLSALDAEGAPVELHAEGFLARAFCHELDHLDGVLFIDRLTGLRKELALRRLRKLPFLEEPS